MSNFSGTVYEMGQAIPAVVTPTITPKIYFDNSIIYDDSGNGTVFDKLSFSSSVVLGDKDDDLWTYEAILTEQLQYLNLHIVQLGFDFYVYNWSSFSNASVTFYNIDDLTDTKVISLTPRQLQRDDFASDGTQITIDDVYNQIGVKCSTDTLEDIIPALIDSGKMTSPYRANQYLCREYVSEMGATQQSIRAFYNLISGTYPTYDDVYTTEWVYRVKERNGWKCEVGGVNCYNSNTIKKDANDVAYDQRAILDYVFNNTGASCFVAFGKGEKIGHANRTQENITSLTDYLVMSVNGRFSQINDNPVQIYDYPSADTLKNLGINVEYRSAQAVSLSPASPDVTNYIVISGDILMQPFTPRYGSRLTYNLWGKTTKDVEFSTTWANAMQNTFNNAELFLNTNVQHTIIPDNVRRSVIPSLNDKGRYYQVKFDNTQYSGIGQTRTYDGDALTLMPPVEQGEQSKYYKYEVGDKALFEADVIDYIPILECQLRIGDKYLTESFDVTIDTYGTKKSTYSWKTLEAIAQDNNTTVADVQNNIRMYATFSIGIEPKTGSYVVGDEQSFKNTVTTEMGISKKGLAIPIKQVDNINGDVEFHILGPINVFYDTNNGSYRRREIWYADSGVGERILNKVQTIFIKNIKFEFVSDNGGNDYVGEDKDILYLSDEQQKFLEKKNNIDFKVMTQLTPDEMQALGTKSNAFKNCVLGNDGNPVGNYFNAGTETHAKPEKLYVDAYYTLYKDVHKVLETDIHIAGDVVTNFFKRYSVNWLSGTYYPTGVNYDLNNDTIKLTLRDL